MIPLSVIMVDTPQYPGIGVTYLRARLMNEL